ncbi:hypothetical protein B6D60_07125 [candidate division KSB1 bacterium 4484_87]|nr:MAG: hypothetical protein B6D60_07125 [candidate division KSB1 bacterium 4484_87]
MLKRLTAFLVIIFIVTQIPCFAADENQYKKHPGYVDFSKIQIPRDAEETVEVFLQSPILKIVAAVTESKDQALAKMLENLLLIRVNTFKLHPTETAKIVTEINRIENMLHKQKWEKIVRVKDKKDRANIFLKIDDNNRIAGLVVMAIDDDNEAVFVNIVGNIDMDQVAKVGKKFKIEGLEEIEPEK